MSGEPSCTGANPMVVTVDKPRQLVCTVTGSTHAGMVVGFAADGRERNVISIDASCTPAQTKAQVLDIAQKTSDLRQ
jgi:1-aminocyclopropane-1-carboxylate deaminase/D-cysteine desulfhydrase-like pyridoxal-dependent ACC family enzyme